MSSLFSHYPHFLVYLSFFILFSFSLSGLVYCIRVFPALVVWITLCRFIKDCLPSSSSSCVFFDTPIHDKRPACPCFLFLFVESFSFLFIHGQSNIPPPTAGAGQGSRLRPKCFLRVCEYKFDVVALVRVHGLHCSKAP